MEARNKFVKGEWKGEIYNKFLFALNWDNRLSPSKKAIITGILTRRDIECFKFDD
jgi:hypothetical protein